MIALTVFKEVTKFVVSVGTGSVVGNVIKATTPTELNRIQNIAVRIGTIVVGTAVSGLAAAHAEKTIDEMSDAYKKAKGEVYNAQHKQ